MTNDDLLAQVEELERRFTELFLLVYAIRGAVEQRGVPKEEIEARIRDLREPAEAAGKKAHDDVQNRKPQ